MPCKFLTHLYIDLFFMHERSWELSEPIKLKILSDEKEKKKKIELCFMHKKVPLCERFFIQPEESYETKPEGKKS